MQIQRRSAPISQEFGEELLQLFARQGRRVPLPVFLVGLVSAVLVMRHIAPLLPLAWLCLLGLMLALRWVVHGWLAAMHAVEVRRRLAAAVALSALNGVVFSLPLAFFSVLSDFERTVQTTLLIALCAGSVGTSAGYLPRFLAFMVPTLTPLSLVWAWHGADSGESWIGIAMALLVLLLGLILFALSRDAFRMFRESYDIRLEKDALNARLRDALERAETANRAKTRFLASASHDLRQPLHTLSIFAAALAMRPLDDRSRVIIGHMNEALSGLSSELDALLDVSRLDAGLVSCCATDFAARPFLERVCLPFFSIAAEKGLQASLECADGLRIRSDPRLLARVLRNLLENACRYTDSGYVKVSLGEAGETLRLVISDSGVGIAAGEQDRIFDEFYQVGNRERSRAQGLGLGLAIVRRLLELLQVPLELASSPGAGSCFTLVLARAPDQEAPPTLVPAPALPALAGLRLLVIDDEAPVRLAMQELLSSHGCQVSSADCMADALAQAARSAPDAVLADLRLRGMEDGIVVIHALRQRLPGLPALLVSGDTAPERLQEAASAGIRLLHKPLRADLLLSAIAQVTGRSAAQSAATPELASAWPMGDRLE
jgi:signal transduction histidine kinase/CheY-like chemotaxis protein